MVIAGALKKNALFGVPRLALLTYITWGVARVALFQLAPPSVAQSVALVASPLVHSKSSASAREYFPTVPSPAMVVIATAAINAALRFFRMICSPVGLRCRKEILTLFFRETTKNHYRPRL